MADFKQSNWADDDVDSEEAEDDFGLEAAQK